ncbi:MAG: hypothetical protein IMZ66_12890, partial [Planctomycetes bacterium]|nr:hypothetical protein [Planctomycetota bacterium]
MNEPARIEIRPAVRRDSTRLEEFLATAPPTAGAAESADSLFLTDVRSRVIALSDGTVVATCPYIGGSGRCAVIPPPRMFQ